MSESQSQLPARIYNIKGLSWMLKSSSGTSSACSTTSSQINQQFKVFKLKDEKKKWKKKINKKFQTVGEQIQTIIRHKYTTKQPFDITLKQNSDTKHSPHLRQGKSFISSTSPSLHQQSRLSQTKKQILRITQKGSSNSISQNLLSQKFHSGDELGDQYQFEKRVIGLRKVFGQVKNQNSKVRQSKNIMKIHSQQKEYLDKQNNEFFKRQHQWIDEKVQLYNLFNIKDYEKDLIQKICHRQN